MILVKLGGSVITDKSVPLSFRREAVSGLAGSISGIMREAEEAVIVVHGGGSFGHHYSMIYDMHTKPDTYDIEGVAAVKNSMVKLNGMILEIFLDEGALPHCCPPSVFIHGNYPVPDRLAEMAQVADLGMCPVTFGDAIWCGSQDLLTKDGSPSMDDGYGIDRGMSYILSGDRIMTILSEALRPRMAIFAMDVDGLYTSPDSGALIPEASGRTAVISQREGDVTGGMERKVREAAKIAGGGVDVFFVNGNNPDRITAAVIQGSFEGTLFRGSA